MLQELCRTCISTRSTQRRGSTWQLEIETDAGIFCDRVEERVLIIQSRRVTRRLTEHETLLVLIDDIHLPFSASPSLRQCEEVLGVSAELVSENLWFNSYRDLGMAQTAARVTGEKNVLRPTMMFNLREVSVAVSHIKIRFYSLSVLA